MLVDQPAGAAGLDSPEPSGDVRIPTVTVGVPGRNDQGAILNDWLHNLPVGWMAVVFFGAAYLSAAVIYAVPRPRSGP